MKASVVTLALFGAAAIANPVAVEKREIEPRALNLVPALTNIPGAAGLGTLGNIAIITTILNAADAFAAFATLSQTIQNTIATLRAGVPGNALAPVTAITGLTGNPVSAIPAGTTLTPDQILALATSLQYQLGNLTLLTSNLPTGGLLGGGLSAPQLGSIQNGLGVLQGALTPVLNPTGLLANLGNLGGATGAVSNLGPLQTLLAAIPNLISVVTGLLGLLGGLGGLGGLVGGSTGGILGGGIGL
ncbi:unnamed protein product [Colletotrichum noveboracense]|uniref:Uncharacterized protein n=1 Tax=Colletotrichum noveboracense TaxID=2664923 RepID=A0A9W4S7P2_9PEZI|nr:hypothetical protein COL940_000707 [Colletotrichum noveboracense]KAJ0293081.1 hypothetical protein CBS470a_002080 [Colletotrichum nupharicola]KAJ0325351.1 hypothetical protein Brms1b_000658 [Colletotrichum noveboracense]CAI0654470.1 unnamed protein product [Colletotrichum noveboracense]